MPPVRKLADFFDGKAFQYQPSVSLFENVRALCCRTTWLLPFYANPPFTFQGREEGVSAVDGGEQ